MGLPKAVLLSVVFGGSCALQFTRVNANGERDRPDEFVFVFLALALGALFRSLLRMYNVFIPYPVLIMVAGGAFGYASRFFTTIAVYTEVVHMPPIYILMTFVPILVFKTALFIDAHTFMRSWVQISLISIPGVVIAAAFLGIITTVISEKWSFSVGVLFGAICTPIYPVEIEKLLKEMGTHTRHVEVLLTGEALVGSSIVFVMFYIITGVLDGHIESWYNIFAVFLRYVCGGLFFGYVFGKFLCYIMRALYNDSVNVLTATLVIAYIGYYVTEECLYVSGVVTLTVIGVMTSIERASLAKEVEMLLLYFWEFLAHVANNILFFIIGVLTIEYLRDLMTASDYAKIVVTYILTLIGRFLGFVLLAPILSRVGYGLTCSHMTVAVWGGLRGAITFCLALLAYHHPSLQRIGPVFVTHATGLVFLTLLLNATTMPIILDVLGLSEISLPRKVNMNNCMKFISSRRERTISMLKMNRFLSDANWPLVNSATLLKHPYKMKMGDMEEEDDNYLLGYRLATCSLCKKEVLGEPTPKEFAEMTREARMRILKAKKISYARQYENGMISQESIRVLRQAVEVAMDTRQALIEIEGLQRLFRKESLSQRARKNVLKLFFEKSENRIRPPRKYYRRICYYIVMQPAFEFIIDVIIVLNIIPISIELATNTKENPPLDIFIKILNLTFFLCYLVEFIMKINAYSWVYVCRDGIKTYFKSCWNCLDFIVIMAALVDLIVDILDLSSHSSFSKSDSKILYVTLAMKLLRTIRLVRLVRVCRALYPNLLRYFDSRIDKHMAFAYDVGKGFVTGEEEVSEMLNQMIDNVSIKEDMKLRMEADRLVITKELGLVQKDRPWIAITVKTKQAIRATLNSMFEGVNELKIAGWVDDVEYRKLLEVLHELLKRKTKIKSIEPSPPSVIFKEIPWMSDDPKITDFLFDNVMMKVFDPGDVVCSDKTMADGIYIVITGLLKLTYTPQPAVLEELVKYGALPIYDYITSTRFDERIEDYIVSGNSFGELSVITNRPYNCTIVADTPSQVYVITHEIIREAMERSPDPINGLEARMWKTISIHMALAILLEVPAYQSLSQEKIRFELERAFIPDLKNYKIFVVNDMMEDVILIYGVTLDYNTHDVYTAPTYIPRTVEKLVLPRSSRMKIKTKHDTKILIIPARDVDEYEVMEKEEEISEMVSTASFRCLQHLVMNRKVKKKRRKTVFAINQRKTQSQPLSSTRTLGSRMTNTSSMAEESELQDINMNSSMIRFEDGKNNLTNIVITPYKESAAQKPSANTSKSSKSILKNNKHSHHNH